MEADTLIDHSAAIRPTRKRLLAAMGIASGLVAFVLALPEPHFDIASSISEPGVVLSVQIRQILVEKAPQMLPPEQLAAEEPVELPPAIVPINEPDVPLDSEPVTDWHAIADAAARASADDYIEEKESRASLWQQTHSVMFRPGDEIVLMDEEPLLADIRFIHRARVFGLGLNIGSCFIGIPIAGVPVEQRSGAITIFVCTQDS